MSSRRAAGRARGVRLLAWAALALLVGFIAFCGVWRLEGGRWVRVETPSMGMTAPVGTLLWVMPTDVHRLHVGDFITFHPPGHRDVTYSHRVYRINPDGTLSTKGVIPAPDPWRLTGSDIVGEVRMRWWGAGWLIVAAPVLIVGSFAVAGLRSLISRDWRAPATILLSSMVVTVAIMWSRPFINAQQLAFAPDHHGGASASYVGTGLLPIRLTARGGHGPGASVVMRDGQVGTVRITQADGQHRLQIDLHPAVPWWLWVGIVGMCFLPAGYSLVVGSTPRPTQAAVG